MIDSEAQTQLPLENELHRHFGLPGFRRGQREIIESALGRRDVLAVLPTGGGKSLCYQLPATVLGRLVVVISPLIALMRDQVEALKRANIPAGSIHSGQSDEEKRAVFRQMSLGGPFVLYVSPERTQKDGFKAWIKNSGVALFAVDEAHCVSQWGHDFREEYSQLKLLKELCPDVPVLALTASATPFVLNDIAKQLGLAQPVRHVHGFYRPNLYYQVESCATEEEKFAHVVQAIEQTPAGRILIYCGTRNVTEELAGALAKSFPSVGYYHAGLNAASRTETQDAYGRGEIRILCATNAFGMGIDHPDVRLVVHYQMPGNIDALYQEMGRAGRDGRPSTCLMLYAKKDKGLQSFFITQSKAPTQIQSSRWRGLDNLIAYCEGGECRHAEILTYYQDSQRIQSCGHCDTCDPKSDRRVRKPAMIERVGQALGLKKRRGAPSPAGEALDVAQMQIFERLRAWRKMKAKELDVPAFVVLSDKTLRHLAQSHPTEINALERIYGLGEKKIEKFGADLIATITNAR